jgi:ubiquinone/menaquinone biosynthesis C-methylase UbiE
MVMDDPEAVAAFDLAHPILQAPIYRLNALALSRLLPVKGTLLDLGSGTGRLLIELAIARPDVRLYGRDLAPNMVRAGREALAAAGLEERVELAVGDMTRVGDVPDRVDVVSCIWALHHLATRDEALRCLREIARVRDQHGAAVWIFDFARMQRAEAFRAVLDQAPSVPPRLYEDGLASERAAWTVEELGDLLRDAGLGDLSGGGEQRVGHLQAWTSPPPVGAAEAHERHWRAPPLPLEASSALAERLAAGLDAASTKTGA